MEPDIPFSFLRIHRDLCRLRRKATAPLTRKKTIAAASPIATAGSSPRVRVEAPVFAEDVMTNSQKNKRSETLAQVGNHMEEGDSAAAISTVDSISRIAVRYKGGHIAG